MLGSGGGAPGAGLLGGTGADTEYCGVAGTLTDKPARSGASSLDTVLPGLGGLATDVGLAGLAGGTGLLGAAGAEPGAGEEGPAGYCI